MPRLGRTLQFVFLLDDLRVGGALGSIDELICKVLMFQKPRQHLCTATRWLDSLGTVGACPQPAMSPTQSVLSLPEGQGVEVGWGT